MNRTSRESLAVFVAITLAACGGAASEARPVAAFPDVEPERRPVPEASALVKEGEALLARDDAAGARASFERAIAESPDDARAHLDLGIALELLDDPEGAEHAYRRAIELQPDLAEGLNNLAVLQRTRGALDEALALLRRAIAANPRSAAAHGNLALALEDAGDLDGAERAYREALVHEPGAVMTRVNLGLLLVGRGDTREAVIELERARGQAEGDRAALLAIGNGLRRAGEPEAALGAMEAAVAADEDVTPALLAELALAQRAAGNRDEALATLDRALALDKGYATAHFLRATMLAGSGRVAEARKDYKRYLALEPEGPHAAKAREHLERLK